MEHLFRRTAWFTSWVDEYENNVNEGFAATVTRSQWTPVGNPSNSPETATTKHKWLLFLNQLTFFPSNRVLNDIWSKLF